jgi:hypothetical protein
MKEMHLDVDALEVETFTPQPAPTLARVNTTLPCTRYDTCTNCPQVDTCIC